MRGKTQAVQSTSFSLSLTQEQPKGWTLNYFDAGFDSESTEIDQGLLLSYLEGSAPRNSSAPAFHLQVFPGVRAQPVRPSHAPSERRLCKRAQRYPAASPHHRLPLAECFAHVPVDGKCTGRVLCKDSRSLVHGRQRLRKDSATRACGAANRGSRACFLQWVRLAQTPGRLC